MTGGCSLTIVTVGNCSLIFWAVSVTTLAALGTTTGAANIPASTAACTSSGLKPVFSAIQVTPLLMFSPINSIVLVGKDCWYAGVFSIPVDLPSFKYENGSAKLVLNCWAWVSVPPIPLATGYATVPATNSGKDKGMSATDARNPGNACLASNPFCNTFPMICRTIGGFC